MPVSSKGKTTSGKKNTGKSKTTNRKNPKNTGKKNQKQESSFLRNEIVTLISLGISILLLLSCFGVGGYVGEFVRSVLFGIFGTAAYAFPFLLFIGTAFHASNRGNVIAALKIAAGAAAFLLLCSLFQLLGADQAEAQILGFYAYGAEELISGGLVGGVIVSAMYPALGMAGELIVSVILLIICAVITRSTPLWATLRRAAAKWRTKPGRMRPEERSGL